MDFEDNPKNPTISPGFEMKVEHYFQIKYKNEYMKNKMVQLVLKLVEEHEIDNFYIEEKLAFRKNRILYNYNTLVSEDGSFDYKILKEGFLRLQK